jgi:hypothetical protein
MRRNKAAIASWFVVIEYRLCRCRHNLYYADLWIMPTIGSELSLAAVIAASESA